MKRVKFETITLTDPFDTNYSPLHIGLKHNNIDICVFERFSFLDNKNFAKLGISKPMSRINH